MKMSAAWRKKRQEVFALYGAGCADCGELYGRIDVHHRYYETGKKVHEYPIKSLIPLCPRCHGLADELRRDLNRALGVLGDADSWRALGYMHALRALDASDDDAVNLPLRNWEHAFGCSRAIGCDVDWLIQQAGSKRHVVIRSRQVVA